MLFLSVLCVLGGQYVAADATAEADRLAAAAIALAESKPAEALTQARKALALTADFEPTAFVKAGRKGEVIEDAYLAARTEYRRHRARLYEAVGECLARAGRPAPAARYLRRALDLERSEDRARRLARAFVALDRGRAALDVLLGGAEIALGPESIAVAEDAANAAGVPSLQAEIDHARLARLKLDPRPEYRDGPFPLPGAHLSTGPPFRLDSEGPSIVYVAEASCRSCSADLESLKRATPAGLPLALLPGAAEDQALRQTMALYRFDWPIVVGARNLESLRLAAPCVLVAARGGWTGVVAKPPLAVTLPPVLDALRRIDVRETRPRTAWNQRPVERKPEGPRPRLLPEGLAPAEEEPAPEAFLSAVAAYRAKHPAEALRLFDSLDAQGDGFLLPPEARLNRALCLGALGHRDAARRLLLRTGDSRFQDAVDRALETVGSPSAK